MIRRIIVFGGRDFWPPDHPGAVEEFERVWHELTWGEPAALGEGGARGADRWAREWGMAQPGVQVVTRPANWERHGKAAGMIRNGEMAAWAAATPGGAAIGFPGGRGTEDMARRAGEAGLELRRIRA